MAQETRSLATAEIRVAQVDGQPRITGRPIVFNQLSEDMGGFRERVRPEAIDLEDRDIISLFNHDPNQILGRTNAGTLQTAVDADGVTFVAEPPAAQWARDLVVSIERGDVPGGSFTFEVLEGGEQWERGSDGVPVRNLTSIRVLEMGPVVFPAYPQTSTDVALRSLESWRRKAGAAPPKTLEKTTKPSDEGHVAAADGESSDRFPVRSMLRERLERMERDADRRLAAARGEEEPSTEKESSE